MADYTIEQVVEAGEQYSFQGNDGTVTLVPYTLMLEGQSQPVTLNQLPDSAPPKDGDLLDGEIRQSKRGLTFKKAQKGGYGRSNGSSGDEPGRFDRKPEHPENVARMRHTSALSAAPDYIEQMLTVGAVPQPKTKDEYVKLAEGVMTWLEGTYTAS